MSSKLARFTLRGTLIAVTLACVLFGALSYEARRLRQRHAAAARLAASGAYVTSELRPNSAFWAIFVGPAARRVTQFVLPGAAAQVTREQLELIKQLDQVDHVYVAGTDLTDEEVADLVALRPRAITINGGKLSDSAIDLILSTPTAESIDLGNVAFNGDRPVEFSPYLRSLHLTEPTVSDRFIVGLRACPRLSYLYLPGTSVTDAGIDHLVGLPLDAGINFDSTRITGRGIAQLIDASYGKQPVLADRGSVVISCQGIVLSEAEIQLVVAAVLSCKMPDHLLSVDGPQSKRISDEIRAARGDWFALHRLGRAKGRGPRFNAPNGSLRSARSTPTP